MMLAEVLITGALIDWLIGWCGLRFLRKCARSGIRVGQSGYSHLGKNWR